MYNAVIIGAGSIGALKPDKYDSPQTNNVLTWAHACYTHPNIKQTHISDIYLKKAKQAGDKWGFSYSSFPSTSIMARFYLISSDIIIISVPTESHNQVLLDILQYYPKIIITEKPFCMNKKEAKKIIKIYAKEKIPILVNYTRSYNQKISEISSLINKEYFGKIFSCVCYYVRGLKHEGSHAINLFNNIFGKYEGTYILPFDSSIIYDKKNSPSYTVFLKYEKCKNVIMIPIDSTNAYNIFYIEIMTEKGKIVFSDHSKYIEFFPRIKEKTYGNYNTLKIDRQTRVETGLTKTLISVLDNAVDYLKTGKKEFFCTAEDALKVHRIIENSK